MIHIAGPGGAGKTTAGSALARRLGIAFVDVDEQFTAGAGDISAYLDTHGYEAYAERNIQVYLDTIASLRMEAVIALSSGFLTYPDDAHPSYPSLHWDIINSPSTVVLLPSFDYETCVAETVSRQLRRPFSRSAEREEQVIRDRFPVYCKLPVKKFETKGQVDVVVDDLVVHLLPHPLGADGGRHNHEPPRLKRTFGDLAV